MEDWLKMVSSVGFPIVITLYVLLRLENSMRTLSDTVRKLIIALVKSGINVDDVNGGSAGPGEVK